MKRTINNIRNITETNAAFRRDYNIKVIEREIVEAARKGDYKTKLCICHFDDSDFITSHFKRLGYSVKRSWTVCHGSVKLNTTISWYK